MGEVAGAGLRAISQVAKTAEGASSVGGAVAAAAEAPLGAVRGVETTTSLVRESVSTAVEGQAAAGTGPLATGNTPAEAISADVDQVGPHDAMKDLAAGDIARVGERPPLPSSGDMAQMLEDLQRNGGVETRPAEAAAQAETPLVETNVPVTGTSAEGMDKDPRYEQIRQELMEQWRQSHPRQDFLNAEGQGYLSGRLDHAYEDRYSSPLARDTERIFRERYAEDAAGYDLKEGIRVYETPDADPAIRRIRDEILRRTNTDPMLKSDNLLYRTESYGDRWDRANAHATRTEWNKFIDQHPEKAEAYAEKNPEIKAVLERKAQREAAQTQREEGPETSQTEPAVEADNRVAQLEQKMADLSSQNERLSTEVASMKNELAQTREQLATLQNGMRELTETMQSLVKTVEQKAQDPKEKETLAGLLAKLALILTVTA